jgi:hypothetical protein
MIVIHAMDGPSQPRLLSAAVQHAAKAMPVVVLTGARLSAPGAAPGYGGDVPRCPMYIDSGRNIGTV